MRSLTVARAGVSLAAAAMALCLALTSGARAEPRQTASSRNYSGVVELFTSQGCSSCPPAETVLRDLSKQSDLVTIAYHVDYWDYIGWDDTFGSRANTDRQRAYAKAFGTGTIYTPQMVVNGSADVIGSHADDVRTALKRNPLVPARAPDLDLSLIGDRLSISVGGASGPDAQRGSAATGADEALVLTMVTFDESQSTDVARGENKGRTLLNVNPVRDWRMLGMWAGKPMVIEIPVADLRRGTAAKVGCVAILQKLRTSGALGPIVSAAVLKY